MENVISDYVEWIIVIALTLFVFSNVSRKYKTILPLVLTTFFPVWLLTAIIKGFGYYYNDIYELLSLRKFSLIMAEVLVTVIFIGGITFTIVYVRLIKRGNR